MTADAVTVEQGGLVVGVDLFSSSRVSEIVATFDPDTASYDAQHFVHIPLLELGLISDDPNVTGKPDEIIAEVNGLKNNDSSSQVELVVDDAVRTASEGLLRRQNEHSRSLGSMMLKHRLIGAIYGVVATEGIIHASQKIAEHEGAIRPLVTGLAAIITIAWGGFRKDEAKSRAESTAIEIDAEKLGAIKLIQKSLKRQRQSE